MEVSYFTEDRKREILFRRLGWIVTALLALALFVFWEPLRSNDFILKINGITRYIAAQYLFRAFTFLGDDEGHIVLITVVYWCVNKSLGFRTMMVLLFSGIYTHFLKEAFALPRPNVPGVDLLDSLAFPSGHTLSVMAVWGYLAVRLQNKTFWVCAAAAVLLVGLSRMVLGVHFPGDIVGGLFFGFLFLALVFGLSSLIRTRGWQPRMTFPVLFGGLVAVFSLAALLVVRYIPGEDPLKVVGFLAGTGLGYILEKEFVRFSPQGKWYQHVLKVIVGLVILLLIVHQLKAVLPPGAGWGFARYTLAGLWATCLAPLVFTLTGLAAREPLSKTPDRQTASV